MFKYAVRLFYSEEDGGYIAAPPDLPGCSAFGESPEKALKELQTAIDLWLQAARKEGREIPRSGFDKRYSGRMVVRMPQDLHRELDLEAKEQGISLNQWILYKLAHEKLIPLSRRRQAKRISSFPSSATSSFV